MVGEANGDSVPAPLAGSARTAGCLSLISWKGHPRMSKSLFLTICVQGF